MQITMPLPRLGLTRTPICIAPSRSLCYNSIPQRSSHPTATCASHSVTQSWSCSPLVAALASASILLSLGDCPIAGAYNVRLQDVDSPELKAGEQNMSSYNILQIRTQSSALIREQAEPLTRMHGCTRFQACLCTPMCMSGISSINTHTCVQVQGVECDDVACKACIASRQHTCDDVCCLQ